MASLGYFEPSCPKAIELGDIGLNTAGMTQPYAYPVDPFPELACIYDTPVVKAFRVEPGRYFTIDLDGIEISWTSDRDEEIVTIAASIEHRIGCTDADCRACAPYTESYDNELDALVEPSVPPRSDAG